jgi:hypothetical protein
LAPKLVASPTSSTPLSISASSIARL